MLSSGGEDMLAGATADLRGFAASIGERYEERGRIRGELLEMSGFFRITHWIAPVDLITIHKIQAVPHGRMLSAKPLDV